MKSLALIAAMLALATLPAAAQSTSRSYYDSQGQFAGSSSSRGNSSSFYDGQGGFAGSSVRRGNSTQFFDEQGRFVGSSVGPAPRR